MCFGEEMFRGVGVSGRELDNVCVRQREREREKSGCARERLELRGKG